MPGFEIFSKEERREVQDVLDTGVLFRYGFDQARGGHWKAKTFEKEFAERLGAGYCHSVPAALQPSQLPWPPAVLAQEMRL